MSGIGACTLAHAVYGRQDNALPEVYSIDRDRRDKRYTRTSDIREQIFSIPGPGGMFCWCHRCHHHDVLPIALLIAHCGPRPPFETVHGRLRCQACGN